MQQRMLSLHQNPLSLQKDLKNRRNTMYPRVVIDIDKLRNNLDTVSEITKDRGGCSLAVVTKCFCADSRIVKMVSEHPKVDLIADSRIKNIASYTDTAHEKGKKTMLLRIPMKSELEEVVRYVDLCQISEISTIRLLNEEAHKADKVQNILLMIDMGDLREGIFFENREVIHQTVGEILEMENIHLCGVGVNLTCYGAIIPKYENLSKLVEIAREIEGEQGIKLEMISGGNSSSIYLIDRGELPEGINNLRLGESFVLGNDTAYETKIPGTTDRAFILEAEIVELKEKPSLPVGEAGVDAFGQKPHYEDRGQMMRAIVAIGKQDVDLGSIVPLDERIEIMGGSSDHIILDVTNCNGLGNEAGEGSTSYKVGDIVSFRLGYGGLLRVMTSPYVEKVYLEK